jgi:biopolymer transport protein ExbD
MTRTTREEGSDRGGRAVAKPPKAFDVWFVAANTVYKGVPYNVVADWAQQGRLAAADMIRPAGTTVAWSKVQENEFLADYLPRPTVAKAVPAAPPVAAAAAVAATIPGVEVVAEVVPGAPVELPDPEPQPRRRGADDDDDVDMIPLIDVSMVLLVFFIIMRAAGALAPIDVPEMKYAGQLSADPQAITINIDKRNDFEVFYSVRRGQEAPKEGHDNISNPDDALRAVDELLASAQQPPEVRIACRKDLPRERVRELVPELEIKRKKNYINSYAATVIEAPK